MNNLSRKKLNIMFQLNKKCVIPNNQEVIELDI